MLDRIYRLRRLSPKVDLRTMRTLLGVLGSPERRLGTVIHITGTNGKGSTARMLSQILVDQRRRTALYTSPFIVDFRERFQVNGQWIAETELLAHVRRVDAAISQLQRENPCYHVTFFEYITALALTYFAEQQCAFTLLEVGIGGRLDSTNVVDGDIGIITSIGFDHGSILGRTVEAVAAEKAGIAKQGQLLLTRSDVPGLDTIRRVAERRGAEVRVTKRQVPTSLAGEHQEGNAGLALAAVAALNARGVGLSLPLAEQSLRRVSWPGRYERLRYGERVVILDCAHNAEGVGALARQLAMEAAGTILFGCKRSKPFKMMVELLPKQHRLRFTRIPHPLSWTESDHQGEWVDWEEALEGTGPLYVCGSCFLISAVRARCAIPGRWPLG